MKFLRTLLGLMTAAFALLLGAGLLYPRVTNDGLWPWAAAFVRDPVFAFLAGFYIVSVVLIWGLTLLLPSGKAKTIAFETDSGSVEILLDAVRDYLSRASVAVPHVVSVRPVVAMRQNRLVVNLISRVQAAEPVPGIARQLQEQAKSTLRDAMGITLDTEVRVIVKEIQVAPGGAVPPTPREEIRVRPPKFGYSDDMDEPVQGERR